VIAPVAEIARIGDHLDITPNALLNKVDTVVVNSVLDFGEVMVVFTFVRSQASKKPRDVVDARGEHLI
jgi:hypothetical protein